MEHLLHTIRSYVSLMPGEEEIVRVLFRGKDFRKGDHLLEAGKVCRHLYYIDKGLVRYYMSSNGQEQTNYFNKEGEFVCDYLSFLPQVPSGISIQALEDTTVFFINFADLQRFYKEVQAGERFGRLAIEQVFVNVIGQIASLYTDPPDMRYRNFLSSFPDIGQRIPQYYIASYIGVKPPSLSRIRKRIAGGH
jgi:CRP-like cAMP-binding protein